MTDKLKKYLGAMAILIPLACFFGYRSFEQNIESVAVVCPSLVKGGDCGCVTDRFKTNYGVLRGVVENVPIVQHFFGSDEERLMSLLEESARQCGARLVSFDGGTS